jgi:ssDNA-binding Zn-finger/Zn-ribbon topoisomerase 1
MKPRKNGKTGEAFWGCIQFPKCKGTRNSMGMSRQEAQEAKRTDDYDDDRPY